MNGKHDQDEADATARSDPAPRAPGKVTKAPRQEDDGTPSDFITDTSAKTPPATCPLVVVGASAGGLEAASELLESLPPNARYAVVLAQHLDPTHESQLVPLLQRKTRANVVGVTDGRAIEPGIVYVVPPDTDCTVVEGRFRLVPRRDAHSGRNLIDRLFRSASQAKGRTVIGIVLSGTLSDGTAGLGEIKRAGGFAFAQEPESARFSQMPENAIAADNVDFVLAPGAMVDEIERVIERADDQPPEVTLAKQDGQERRLAQVFDILRQGTRTDFSLYKRGTVLRRLHRRMMARRAPDLAAYVKFLSENPDEVVALRQEMLINVTRFFRDTESFKELDDKAWPEITKGRAPDDPIRIWVAGCATGEEAYSLAISAMEHLGRIGRNGSLQVFATDINEDAIRVARAGLYPATIADDVPPHLLNRYFEKVDGGYQVDRSLRASCVFAVQDVTVDPPFSTMDLVSCRNLLIYMQPALQKRVLAVLHYAMNPSGFLFLGSSEAVARHEVGFTPLDNKHRIYAKVAVHPPPFVAFGRPNTLSAGGGAAGARSDSGRTEDEVRREAERVLIDRFGPPSIVVNGNLDVLEFRGDLSPYLTPLAGPASLNVMRLARPGLDVTLRSAIEEAKEKKVTTRRAGVTVDGGETENAVDIEVVPIGRNLGEFHAIVLFRRHEGATESVAHIPRPKRPPAGETTDEHVERLRSELAATRDYLRSIIDDYEASNEELRAANEEALSANEELQSTNEELETAKEELQSTNEELSTLNAELTERSEEIQRVNDDLLNLINSVELPIVMVGPDLRIRRFTPKAATVLNFIPTDVGRPITDMALPFAEDLPALMRDVVESFERRTELVRGSDGKTWQAIVHPYRTSDKRIDGAVLVLRYGRILDEDGAQ